MSNEYYFPTQRPQIGATIGNALAEAFANSRQREQDLAEKLRYGQQLQRQQQQDARQNQMDRQAAMAKASELWRSGDKQGALAIMAPYGAQMEQYEADAPKDWAPKLNQGELDFADTLPMNRPEAPSGPVMPGSSAESDAAEEGALQRQLPPNPIMAAAQAQAKQNKIMAQRLRGTFQDGTSWMLDPDQARREQQGQADQAFYQASGDDGPMADLIREQYPTMRAASAAGGKPLDADDTMKYFQGESRIRASEAAADRRYQEMLDREERRNAEWDRRFPQQEAGRDRRAAIAGANRSATVALATKAGERATEASAREAANTVLRNLGAKEEILADRKYSTMLSNLTTNPNAALDAATSGQWVKLAQGGTGVISDSDMDAFWNRIGGVGQRVDGKIQEIINGQITSGKRQVVADAVRWLAGRAQHNLNGIQKSMEYHFDTSPNLAPYKDQMIGTYFSRSREKIKDRRAIDKARGGGGNLDADLEGL